MQSLWWMPIPVPVKKRPVKPTRPPPVPVPTPHAPPGHKDRSDQGPLWPSRPVRPAKGHTYLPH